MVFRTSRTSIEDRPVSTATARPAEAAPTPWSPAQIVGLVAGVGFAALGIAAVATTGFDTDNVYRPHEQVWRLWHSPLLGVCEIGFGAMLVVASVVPGGLRAVLALLGAAALVFGIVIVMEDTPRRLNDWLAVTDRNGWLFTIVGIVLVAAALLSPTFLVGRRSYVGDAPVRERERVGV